jgi:hypothetical protein
MLLTTVAAVKAGPPEPPVPISDGPADPGTLFPPDQITIDIYGEAAFGDIDFSKGDKTVTTTKTVKGTVLAPTTPTPPANPPVITVATRPGFRGSAVIRPFLTTTTTTTGAGSTTITTIKTVRRVQTTHTEHNAGGGGVQIAYFLTRYVGLAIEGDFLGGNQFISQASGQLILRYPVDMGRKDVTTASRDPKDYKSTEIGEPTWGFAPYFICGGGSQWDGENIGFGDVGGGVEVRCRDGWSVFSDGRWIVRDTHENYAAVRLGMGYSFY